MTAALAFPHEGRWGGRNCPCHRRGTRRTRTARARGRQCAHDKRQMAVHKDNLPRPSLPPSPVAVADISLPISGRLMRTRYPAQFFRGRERRRRKREREANGEREARPERGGTQQLILTALLKGGREEGATTWDRYLEEVAPLVEKPFATVTANV